MAKPKPIQFRAQVSPEVDVLVRAIAPLKNPADNDGKEWIISDIATEALIEWLRKPENRQLIEDHNLIKALEQRGLLFKL
ncbi:MAG: hypothetical protein F6J97_23835 [Leptolyngbya sp. SIO4C1]|nr:hypothetical protein [Leptolyngbya sp. SIO4C1]